MSNLKTITELVAGSFDASNRRIEELERENARLRDGLRSAWLAMDSDDAARCDEWQNEWQHILSNSD
jgi:hypothetical protein